MIEPVGEYVSVGVEVGDVVIDNVGVQVSVFEIVDEGVGESVNVGD